MLSYNMFSKCEFNLYRTEGHFQAFLEIWICNSEGHIYDEFMT
jgi:hypothetical protein